MCLLAFMCVVFSNAFDEGCKPKRKCSATMCYHTCRTAPHVSFYVIVCTFIGTAATLKLSCDIFSQTSHICVKAPDKGQCVVSVWRVLRALIDGNCSVNLGSLVLHLHVLCMRVAHSQKKAVAQYRHSHRCRLEWCSWG